MSKITIVYSTGAGHTEKLAQFIAEGVRTTSATVKCLNVEALTTDDWKHLAESDAIIFGTPTYMGSAAAAFKTFMDHTGDFWLDQTWANKIAAGFTVAVHPSGDKLATLQQLSIFAAQHGMIWVGQDQIGAPSNPESIGINSAGYWLGLSATDAANDDEMITADDAKTAHKFGQRIALAAIRWKG